MKLTGFTTALFFILMMKLAAGQGLPPGWDFTLTNVDHVIAVRLSTGPNINGVPLNAGDYIGVFYYDGAIQYCGGAAEWNGTSNIAVIAYGDDVTTPSKDGFYYGEPFFWRIYSWSAGVEYEAIASYDPAYPQHDGTFYSYGFSALESLDADDLEVTVTIGNDTLCEGEGTQLFSSVNGGSGVNSFNWSSSPPGFTSTEPNPIIQPTSDTWFHLEVTTYLAVASDSTHVTVIPLAPQHLYLQNETVSDAQNFTGNVIEAGQAVTDPPEGPFIIESGASVNFKGGDTIYLKDGFTAQNGCDFRAYIDEIACLQIPPLLPGYTEQQEGNDGIIMNTGNIDNVQDIAIFPNPSGGLFKVRINGFKNEDVVFEVVDLIGNVLIDRTQIKSPEFIIDIGNRPNGIYLVRIFSHDEFTVRKLIKH